MTSSFRDGTANIIRLHKAERSGQEHLKKEWKEYITIIDDIVNGGMGND